MGVMNDAEGDGFPPSKRPRRAERLLVLEDEPHLLRVYERQLGEAKYDVVTVQTLADAKQVLDDPNQHFEAAILDYSLPDGTGAELVQPLLERIPLCKSLIVTGASAEEAAFECARVGAHGYFRKPGTPSSLMSAVARTVRATLEWREALGQGSPRQDPDRTVARPDEPLPFAADLRHAVARLRYIAKLSPVETITAWRILWGDTNAEIARHLGSTPRTVKYHVSEVLARTGARSRAGLLRVLLEDGGISDPWETRLDPPNE